MHSKIEKASHLASSNCSFMITNPIIITNAPKPMKNRLLPALPNRVAVIPLDHILLCSRKFDFHRI